MTSEAVIEAAFLFLRDLFASGKVTFDEAQALGLRIRSVIKDGLGSEQLLTAVKKLDDGFPVLTPLVLKLVAEWAKDSK